MTASMWLGSIYLKEGGGYRIILKALGHYRRRLKTITHSPELRDAAAMFATVLHQQAAKTVPEIDAVTARIHGVLGGGDADQIARLSDDVPFIEKALACYRADIQKAQDTGHEYFVKMVGDMESAKDDAAEIESALQNIGIFEPMAKQAE